MPAQFSNLSVFEWLMLAAALFLAVGGAWVMRGGREEPEQSPDRPVRELTMPTRFAVGLALLVLAYHLMAWALPVGATLLRCPPGYWWALLLVLAMLVTGSIGIDRLERRGNGG